jgi:hypothetical protein
MGIFRWLIGGLIGGAIGAAVWAAISYFANAEVGWIAWGIGFVVGLGVRIAAGEEDGYGPGLTAVVIAVLAVLAGKYAAVSLAVDKVLNLPVMTVTTDDMIVREAEQIVATRTEKGEKVQWPPNMTAADATELSHYPPDIAAEARQSWQKLEPDEQKRRTDEAQERLNQFQEKFGGALREAGFRESFSGFDILWFLLATMTAFRLGSGAASDD